MGNNNEKSDLYVGKSVRTLEGKGPVAGTAKYTNDFNFDGQLYAHILRSPHASADIKSIDTSAAEKISGVVKVLTGEEAAKYIDPIPHYIDPTGLGGKVATIRCLALDYVWCYGQPVAVVVAEEKRIAQYAVSKITVDYDIKDPVIDPALALREDAQPVVRDWDSNLITQLPFSNGDPAAFSW